MSRASTSISLPLDSDGFIRRECPTCDRQFKWLPSQPADRDTEEDHATEVKVYYCPYCNQPAALNAWWTKEQLVYAQKVAETEIVAPLLRDFKHDIEGAGKRGFVKFEVTLPPSSRPEPLVEPDDMVLVEFPCHLEEPIKIDENWEGEVSCLVCGIIYPTNLVRVLPDEAEE